MGMRRRLVAFAVAVLVLGSPGVARAVDAEVTSDTATQFYDVRCPTGETVLTRRRMTTTLGVSAYDLIDAAAGRPVDARPLVPRAHALRRRLRRERRRESTRPTSAASCPASRRRGPVDLMYAYVEGRRFLHGWLGFKLGRQYVTDALGWWSFDGGRGQRDDAVLREGRGLRRPRAARRPAASHRALRARRRLARRSLGLRPVALPAFQPATIAPAFGVAIESAGVTWLHGRLTYRRVYNTGPSNTTEFASGLYAPSSYDGARISSERLGYAVDAQLVRRRRRQGGDRLRLLQRRGDATSTRRSTRTSARRSPSALDYDYYVPTFDADCIWNFFAAEPTNDVGLRANVDVNDHISVAGGGHVRVFDVQTAAFNPYGGAFTYNPSPNYVGAYFPTNGHPVRRGRRTSRRGGARARRSSRCAAAATSATRGDRVGGDVFGEHVFESRYIVSAAHRRLAVGRQAAARPEHARASTTSPASATGSRRARRTMLEWEHDINGLVGQRFRADARRSTSR